MARPENIVEIVFSEAKQEIGKSVQSGQQYADRLQFGISNLTRQIGRLTDQPGIQYVSDGKGGYVKVGTLLPSQLTRLRLGWISFRANISS